MSIKSVKVTMGRSVRRLAGLLALLGGLTIPMLAGAAAPNADGPARFILCGAHCSVVDAQGAPVTRRVFEKVDDFSGPVAIYVHEDKTGVIGRDGVPLIKPIHQAIYPLGDKLLLAIDPAGDDAVGQETSTLYDLTGKALFRKTAKELRFSTWDGKVYYRDNCGGEGACRVVFLDDQGTPQAEFAAFEAWEGKALASASVDGKLYGYVDHSLKFVIPPTFKYVTGFKDGVALVTTEAGQGLIDVKGRFAVPPGRFARIFVWDDTPLITAFAPGERNCATYLRSDGAPIVVPAGLCPDSADDFKRLGYAFVRDGDGKMGTIDDRGQQRVRPAYPWLRGISPEYLAFGDQRAEPKLFGIMDATGRVILPLQPTEFQTFSSGCAQPGVLGDVFVGRTSDGYGLIDAQGRWRVAARYREACVVSPSLVAFRIKAAPGVTDIWEFFTPAGVKIDLTSAFQPARIDPVAETKGLFKFTRSVPGSLNTLTGLADDTGKAIIPAEFSNLSYAGDGLWRVERWDTSAGGALVGLYDRNGRVVFAPQFRDLKTPLVGGVTVATTGTYKAVLIDTQGKTLASFDSLFPEYAEGDDLDPVVAQTLDRCFNPDPTAEPEDQPSAGASNQRICANATLRAQSRAVEKRYYSAQAMDCVPTVFQDLRPAYDRALDECADDLCLTRAMQAFQAQVDETARRCTAQAAPPQEQTGPVPKALQARLAKEVSSGLSEETDDPDVIERLHYSWLMLGKQRGVLVTSDSGAHNSPFWLFAPSGKGDWSQVLTDYAGYLRPVEATTMVQNGLPVLRTQQHSSCCEHAVSYFTYDGRAYQPWLSCTQLYDADETPLLFCETSATSPVED